MSKYSRIVFLQDDDFENMIRQIDERIEPFEVFADEMISYLSQWDHGEDEDMHDESSAAHGDDEYFGKAYRANTDDNGSFWFYKLSYNSNYRYASLERVYVS